MTCMGISSDLCQHDFAENGIIHWLNLGMSIAEFGEKQRPWIQLVGVGLVFGFLSVFMVAEALLGPYFSWIGLDWHCSCL
jgi:hypothetical protein